MKMKTKVSSFFLFEMKHDIEKVHITFTGVQGKNDIVFPV